MTGLNQPLGYFRKLAKALLDAVKNREGGGEQRVRMVFRETEPASLTLMQAQHVVAVEHGFDNWAELQKTEAAKLYAAISRRQKRRKFDLPTQERLRQIIRLVGVDIREEVLQRPIHVLSISAITGGMGASAEKALEEARRNARDRPWEIDIGSFQRMVEEHQAMRIMEMCRQEGIPFWERRWLNAHLALTLPDALPREYQEICEIFGVPVPAVTDEQTMSS